MLCLFSAIITSSGIISKMKLFLYKFLLRKRLAAVRSVIKEMSERTTRVDIEALQVERFNKVWKDAWRNVPFYGNWKATYNLPDEIRTLGELSTWPILTKADLRDGINFVRQDVPIPSDRLITGGSTGEPVRMPTWGDPHTAIMQTIGRLAYGIEPGDKTLLLWGHEHLYGKGFMRSINRLKRGVKDWLANAKRVSAYDLGRPAMEHAFNVMRKFQPKFIIGFSPAVLSFVRQNAEHNGEIRSVKVVLCTAGPLSGEEKAEIKSFFGSELCMEYGSVDGGCMAYTRPEDGKYRVFWNTHLLQPLKQPGGECKNIVTRLTKCYVPLIRYDIGDFIDVADGEIEASSALVLDDVKGRPSEMISFNCGVSFFGALIGDCVKQVEAVIASQIAVDEKADYLEIRVVGKDDLSDDDKALIVGRVKLTVRDADKLTIRVVQVKQLFTTIGGKVPRVVRIDLKG